MGEITMQQLKEQRLTPAEKFVLDAIKGVKAREPDSYGNVVWYKDDKRLFAQYFKRGKFWVSYKHIWSVLEEDHVLKDKEITQLLTKLLYKYTNNGQLKIIG